MGCSSRKSVSVSGSQYCSGDYFFKKRDYKGALRCYSGQFEILKKNDREVSDGLVNRIAECLEFLGNSEETLNFFNNLKTYLVSGNETKANLRSTELLELVNEKLVNQYCKQSQYKEALAILEGYKYTNKPTIKNLVRIENRIALCHKYSGDIQKALKIFNEQILSLNSESKQNTEDLPLIYGNIACCYLKIGKFDLCSENLKISLEFKQKGNIKSLTRTYNNYAVCFFKQNDFEKAAEYLLKASKAYNKEGKNEILFAKIINNQIACWVKLEKTDKVEHLLKEYQNIHKAYSNSMNISHLASHFNNMLVYLFNVGRIEELDKCFEDFSKLFEKVSQESFQYTQYFATKSMYLYYNNQISEALEEANKGFNLSSKYIGNEYYEYRVVKGEDCGEEEMNVGEDGINNI